MDGPINGSNGQKWKTLPRLQHQIREYPLIGKGLTRRVGIHLMLALVHSSFIDGSFLARRTRMKAQFQVDVRLRFDLSTVGWRRR